MIVSKTTGTTSSLATATSSKRLSGLVSGLDTDTLVQQMSAGTQSKIDKQMQNKQIALWRQQSYREVTKALTEFQTKYFSSSSSSSSILSTAFFNSTSINNTSSYVNVSGSSSVAKNMVISGISSLAKQAGFSSTHPVSNGKITTGAIYDDFASSKVSGEFVTVNYGGKDYKLTVDSDLMLGSAADSTGNLNTIIGNLNDQINKIADLKGNVSFSTDGAAVTLAATASGTGNVGITDGSTDLLTGLALTKGTPSASSLTGGAVVTASLYTSTNLGDTLAGSTLSFSLNGLTKNIKFDETDKSKYATLNGAPDNLVTYLQGKLDAAYGTGNVTAVLDNGGISFKATNSTSVLTLSSSDKSGVLGMNGALRIYAGETNRINTNKTLEDVSANLTTPLSGAAADGSYKINVNGKDFTFQSTDTINSIMTTINNDSDANVTLTYSNTTNTFSAVAKNGGANSKVDINDVTGNLAASLFGTVGERTVTTGKDAVMNISFDGGVSTQTITRSENSFTLDGVNFNLLAEDPSGTSVNAATPIKFTVNNKTDDLMTKIKDFVTDYNNIIKLVNSKVTDKKPTDGTYLPLTDAQKKEMSESQITSWETNAKKGLLQNDTLLSAVSLNMRLAMTDQVSSLKSALYQIGISSANYSDNGVLTIDDTKLKDALTNDPDKVSALFTSPDGIATKLQDVIKKNVNTSIVDTGVLVQKAGSDDSTTDLSTLASDMKGYDTQITALKTRLATEQEQYYAKFTKLEQYLSQMNSQSSWFSSGSTSSGS